MNKQLLFALLILAIAQTEYIGLNRCSNPPDDYILHQRDSTNYGTTTVEGVVTDEAFYFDGVSAYRDFGTTNIPSTDISISFWAKWDAFNHWSRIMDFSNGPSSDNILVANQATSSDVLLVTFKGNADHNRHGQANFIKPGAWNHYLFTMATSGEQALYVNGHKIGQDISGSHNTPFNIVERSLSYLGRSAWGHDGYFKGTLDDFRIYDRVVSEGERQCLADICDLVCQQFCVTTGDNCDENYYGSYVDSDYGSCPFPDDFILHQNDSQNQGTTEGVSGPASANAFAFNSGYRDFGNILIGRDLTFSWWSKFDESRAWQRIFDFGNGNDSDNVLAAQEGTSNTFTYEQFKEGQKDRIDDNDGFDLNTWHHWAAVNDNGTFLLYQDGVSAGQVQNVAHGTGVPLIERTRSFLGKSNWGHDAASSATVDDFKVFPRVLDEEEIACIAAPCETECTNGLDVCAANGPWCSEQACAILYSDCGLSGNAFFVCQNEPNIDNLSPQSIFVPEGQVLKLYNGKNYENQEAIFSKSVYCLDEIDFQDQNSLDANGVTLIKLDSTVNKKAHLKVNKQ